MSEEVEEVLAKPESMLNAKTKQALLETIKRETERALREGDYASAMDLQNARKLIEKGAWKVRRANPYLAFVAECVPTARPHEGKLTLEETQRLLRECAEKWRQLSPEEKKRLEVKAGEQAVYDYL